MRTRLSFWATSEQSFGWPGLQLATPILDAFGEIDFSKLVDGYELPEARRLPELLQWLTHHVSSNYLAYVLGEGASEQCTNVFSSAPNFQRLDSCLRSIFKIPLSNGSRGNWYPSGLSTAGEKL